MSPHPRPLACCIALSLLASAATGTAGTRSVPVLATDTFVPPEWNRPIAVALEARTVEKDGAFGLHLVRPVFSRGAAAVLVEGYGFEGEGELGLAGGGLVYRRLVGRRAMFETSAFFEGVRSTDGFAYPQLGFGVAFSPAGWVTVRANGYLPLRGKDSRNDDPERWTERRGRGDERRAVAYSRERRSEREPMHGFDVEAELRLPEAPRWVDPRIAVGYSYREAEDRPEVYAGLTARGELHFLKHWVAEAEYRDDAHGIGQEWRVGLRFQMLFGGPDEEGEPVVSGKSNTPRDGKSHVPAEGKGHVPVEAPAAPAPGETPVDPRELERYLPVQRFPWPTVARGTVTGDTRRGGSRSLAVAAAPVAAASPEPVPVEGCCGSDSQPLYYE